MGDQRSVVVCVGAKTDEHFKHRVSVEKILFCSVQAGKCCMREVHLIGRADTVLGGGLELLFPDAFPCQQDTGESERRLFR